MTIEVVNRNYLIDLSHPLSESSHIGIPNMVLIKIVKVKITQQDENNMNTFVQTDILSLRCTH